MVIWETVKTTLELPDELMRTVKIRAVRENRKLKDMIAILLQRGLAQEEGATGIGERVQLPLVHCAHPARAEKEMTPERVADVLLGEEARGVVES